MSNYYVHLTMMEDYSEELELAIAYYENRLALLFSLIANDEDDEDLLQNLKQELNDQRLKIQFLRACVLVQHTTES